MSKLRFKTDANPVSADDFYYDLTKGGYIKLEEFLEPESVEDLRNALALLDEFESGMEELGYLEEM